MKTRYVAHRTGIHRIGDYDIPLNEGDAFEIVTHNGSMTMTTITPSGGVGGGPKMWNVWKFAFYAWMIFWATIIFLIYTDKILVP
jgi:hypothetical protein